MSTTEAPATARVGRSPIAKERPEPVTRQVVRRDIEGNELGPVDLDPQIFGIEPHRAVLHQVITAQLAAARAGSQSTLTRAEARGGGAKPYRQKGTGRARQGSTRSPHWVGGGVALGPKPRSFRQRTPKKMVRLALRSALSDRAGEERIALVDAWSWSEPRTKSAVAALEALGLDGRVLVVLTPFDVVAERSFANLPDVDSTLVSELSAYDVLRADWVVFTDETLGRIGSGAEPRDDEQLVVAEVEDEETGETVVSEEVVEAEAGEVVAELQEADIEADEPDEAGESGEEEA